MTKRKKITILILAGIILAGAGVLVWAFKSGKIKPRAEGEPAYSVAQPVNLRRIVAQPNSDGNNDPDSWPQYFNDISRSHYAFTAAEKIYRYEKANGLYQSNNDIWTRPGGAYDPGSNISSPAPLTNCNGFYYASSRIRRGDCPGSPDYGDNNYYRYYNETDRGSLAHAIFVLKGLERPAEMACPGDRDSNPGSTGGEIDAVINAGYMNCVLTPPNYGTVQVESASPHLYLRAPGSPDADYSRLSFDADKVQWHADLAGSDEINPAVILSRGGNNNTGSPTPLSSASPTPEPLPVGFDDSDWMPNTIPEDSAMPPVGTNCNSNGMDMRGCWLVASRAQVAFLINVYLEDELTPPIEDPDKILLEWDMTNTNYAGSDDTDGFQIFQTEGGEPTSLDQMAWLIDAADLTGEGQEVRTSGGYFFTKISSGAAATQANNGQPGPAFNQTIEPGHTYYFWVYTFDSDGNCGLDDPERNDSAKHCPPPAMINISIPDS